MAQPGRTSVAEGLLEESAGSGGSRPTTSGRLVASAGGFLITVFDVRKASLTLMELPGRTSSWGRSTLAKASRRFGGVTLGTSGPSEARLITGTDRAGRG